MLALTKVNFYAITGKYLLLKGSWPSLHSNSCLHCFQSYQQLNSLASMNNEYPLISHYCKCCELCGGEAGWKYSLQLELKCVRYCKFWKDIVSPCHVSVLGNDTQCDEQNRQRKNWMMVHASDRSLVSAPGLCTGRCKFYHVSFWACHK
jgi:hypothetical protein